MNLDQLKKQFQSFLGQDPMRPFVAMWAGIFAGIIVLSLAIFIMLHAKISAVYAEGVGYRSQLQLLSEMNVTPSNMQEVLNKIRSGAASDQTSYIADSEVPVVIQNLSKAASANQVILRKINSLPPEDMTDFAARRLPISLQTEGEFANIGNFLSAVKLTTKWFFTVEEIRIAGDAKRSGRISADLKLSFYSRK